MLQRVLGLLLSVIALFHLGTVAAAASLETETPFVFSVDRESYYGGERIELTVDTTTAQKDIAGFCVSIAYDDTRLSFLRVEPSSQIKNKTLQTDGTNNPVRSTYVCNVDLGHAPALSGTILTYVFEVNEGAPAGETELEVVVDQVCNWQGEQLDSRCEGKAPLEVLPPKSDRAFLESLEPSSGKLSPSFSADIYHYTLDVPYRVSSVTFDAQAGENGTVSVSRKTLQKAGSTTSITITATSENQKQKTQYLASSLFARRDRICVGCRRGRTVFDLSGKGGRGRFGQCQPGKAESRGDFDGNQNYRCVIGQKEPAGVYGYCEPGVGRIRFRRIIPVFSHRVTAVRRDFGAAIFPGHFGIYITRGFGCAVRDLSGERLGRGNSFHQSKDAL